MSTSTTTRRLARILPAILALFLANASLATAADPTTAPIITDPAGDANGVNGQGRVPGAPSSPATKPASVDSADLRSVWFSTEYAASKVRDPETGAVLQVKHFATALVVNIKTEAPIHPASTPQMRPLNYDVLLSIPSCAARLRLVVTADPATDSVGLGTLAATCPGGIHDTGGEITRPTYDGSLATLKFPFAVGTFGDVLKPGTAISSATASANRPVPFAGSIMLDDTAAGATFTIGQDVPADIDCVADPSNAACVG